jgi:hypothetical protein
VADPAVDGLDTQALLHALVKESQDDFETVCGLVSSLAHATVEDTVQIHKGLKDFSAYTRSEECWQPLIELATNSQLPVAKRVESIENTMLWLATELAATRE